MLNIISSVQREMSTFACKLKNNYQVGTRLAEIKGKKQGFTTGMKSVLKRTNRNDLPLLLCFIGTFSPIPWGGPIGYGIGKVAKKSLNIII